MINITTEDGNLVVRNNNVIMAGIKKCIIQLHISQPSTVLLETNYPIAVDAKDVSFHINLSNYTLLGSGENFQIYYDNENQPILGVQSFSLLFKDSNIVRVNLEVLETIRK